MTLATTTLPALPPMTCWSHPQVVPKDVLPNLGKLKALFLSHNLIEALPDNIGELKWVPNPPVTLWHTPTCPMQLCELRLPPPPPPCVTPRPAWPAWQQPPSPAPHPAAPAALQQPSGQRG